MSLIGQAIANERRDGKAMSGNGWEECIHGAWRCCHLARRNGGVPAWHGRRSHTTVCGLGLLPEPAVASSFHLADQLAWRLAQIA